MKLLVSALKNCAAPLLKWKKKQKNNSLKVYNRSLTHLSRTCFAPMPPAGAWAALPDFKDGGSHCQRRSAMRNLKEPSSLHLFCPIMASIIDLVSVGPAEAVAPSCLSSVVLLLCCLGTFVDLLPLNVTCPVCQETKAVCIFTQKRLLLLFY